MLLDSVTRFLASTALMAGLAVVSSPAAGQTASPPWVPYRLAVELAGGERAPGGPLSLVASIRLAPPLLVYFGGGFRTYQPHPPRVGNPRGPAYLAGLRLQATLAAGMFAGVAVGLSSGQDWADGGFGASTDGSFWSWALRPRVNASLAFGWDFGSIFVRADGGLSLDLTDPEYCFQCGSPPGKTTPFFDIAVGYGTGREPPPVEASDDDTWTNRALVMPTALTLPAGTMRLELVELLAPGFVYAPVARLEVSALFLVPVFRRHELAQASVKVRLLSAGRLHLAAVAGGWFFSFAPRISEIWGGGLLASIVAGRAVFSLGLVGGRAYQNLDEGNTLKGVSIAGITSAIVELVGQVSFIGEGWVNQQSAQGAAGLRLRVSRCGLDVGMLINPRALTTLSVALPWLRMGCRI